MARFVIQTETAAGPRNREIQPPTPHVGFLDKPGWDPAAERRHFLSLGRQPQDIAQQKPPSPVGATEDEISPFLPPLRGHLILRSIFLVLTPQAK